MEYLANLTSAAKATYPLLASTSRRHQTSYLSPFPKGISAAVCRGKGTAFFYTIRKEI
jgi:hypothetical protein